eukprot:gene12878-14108_t
MYLVLLFLFSVISSTTSYTGKFIFHLPHASSKPELILISGCTGTGKSTFGMTLALNRGIVRCISTDSVRQVLRSFSNNTAVHRSSYGGVGDPVLQWRECCSVLDSSIENLVQDSIARGSSLVLEGVHIVPSNHLLDRWTEAGGVAIGIVLSINDPEAHKNLIFSRGEASKKGADHQIKALERIRTIQEEMIRLGKENNWLQIERKIEPDPIDVIHSTLERKIR